MKYLTFIVILFCLLTAQVVQGQTEPEKTLSKIEEAMSAAPSSISENATILDYPTEPGGQNIVCAKAPMVGLVALTTPIFLVTIQCVWTLRCLNY